jgi:hypothetical protein
MMANVALQTEKRAFQQSLAPVAQRFTGSARMPARLPVRKESTAVHPVAVLIPLAACASFFTAAWIGFAADREAAVSVFMAGFVNLMLMGLLVGGGWYCRDVTSDGSIGRTFRAFFRGAVDTATDKITGREALIQIAAMPVILSIGGMIIIACAAFCGVGG